MSIQKTKEWFELAVPSPSSKNFNVQLGVHFEEIHEMLAEVKPVNEADIETIILLAAASAVCKQLGDHLKTKGSVVMVPSANRLKFLDAIADQLVTAVGCAHMQHMNVVAGLDEVNRSNFSKFKNGSPVFNENGKIMKNPDTYSEPDLSPYI